jgi:siroheme synthase
MECENPELLEQWMASWRDLMEFEVIPVVTSADAVAAFAPRP